MRKRLYCVLCVFLCLLLCSCQSEHASLLTMVEDGQYSEAIEYINQLAREEIYAEQEGKDPHPLTPYLYGTWESAVDKDVPIFQFNEDGTCFINGKAHLWRETITQEALESRVQFDILQGDRLTFVFQLIQWSGGVYSGSVDQMKNDTRHINHFSNLRNRDHFQRVEITEKNWQTYFEIVRDVSFDEFNYYTPHLEEVTCIGISQKVSLVLKDEYYGCLDTTFSKITVDYKYRLGTQPILYDWDKKTYTLNGDFEPFSDLHEYVKTDSLRTMGGNLYGLCIDTSWNSIEKSPDGGPYYLPWYADHIQVVNIEGALFFPNEA